MKKNSHFPSLLGSPPMLLAACYGGTRAGLVLSWPVCIDTHTARLRLTQLGPTLPFSAHRIGFTTAGANECHCCLWSLWEKRERVVLVFSNTALDWDLAQVGIFEGWGEMIIDGLYLHAENSGKRAPIFLCISSVHLFPFLELVFKERWHCNH